MLIDHDPRLRQSAWTAQRTRLRTWLDSLPADQWSGPTRCGLWDVSKLVRHLVSGSQFLGYTLHKASGGVATTSLKDFDPHGMVQERAARLGEMAPEEARDALASMDASVAAEVVAVEKVGWSLMAEAPWGTCLHTCRSTTSCLTHGSTNTTSWFPVASTQSSSGLRWRSSSLT